MSAPSRHLIRLMGGSFLCCAATSLLVTRASTGVNAECPRLCLILRMMTDAYHEWRRYWFFFFFLYCEIEVFGIELLVKQVIKQTSSRQVPQKRKAKLGVKRTHGNISCPTVLYIMSQELTVCGIS